MYLKRLFLLLNKMNISFIVVEKDDKYIIEIMK